jgi:hypothetical protein
LNAAHVLHQGGMSISASRRTMPYSEAAPRKVCAWPVHAGSDEQFDDDRYIPS